MLDDVLFHVNFYFLLFPFSFVLLVIMCALCIVFNKTCFIRHGGASCTTSRIAAPKLDFSISHDRNSVLILCIM